MKHKDIILKLRQEGKTYDEIQVITGASKGTIAYHCGDGQREKTRTRSRKRRESPIVKKADAFQDRKASKSLENRIDGFQRERKGNGQRTQTFDWKDVIKRHGVQTTCYLTGRPLDLNDGRAYQFDHIIPVSKGGSDTLDNLGVTSTQANKAKSDMTVDEFIQLCKEVLMHNGYSVTKGSPETTRTSTDRS